MTDSNGQLRFGDFRLDVGARELAGPAGAVSLQPKVFETLVVLIRRSDRVLTKDELLECVWPGVVVTENVLARAISALRKALGDDPRSPRYIQAVPRVGYRFIAAVERDGDKGAERSLAVLPFRHLADDDYDQGLGLGVAEALINRLSNLPGLVVRRLSTAREVAQRLSDPAAVARHLRADVYLEGTVQRHADRVRVSARLLATDSPSPLWSETFDERLSDLFALQDTICERILVAIAPTLRLTSPRTPVTDAAAYRAYLEGRLFLGRATPEDVGRARERFDRALDVDPGYSPAWAGIAECHEYLGTMGSDPPRHYREADRAARRALAIRPTLDSAMNMRAKIAWQFDWDWARAERLFEAALRQSPGNADLHIAYSDYCCFMNYEDRSIAHAEAALHIDPVSPWVNTLVAQAYYMAGRFEEAARQIDRALDFAADFAFAHFFSGLIRIANDEPDVGIASIERAVASGRPDFFGAYGMCLGLIGRTQQAEGILQAIVAQGEAAPPIARAAVYTGLKRYDEAADEFRRCLEDRDWHVLLLHADPLFAHARSHPEIAALLQELELP